jgi:two-component system, LytTR family, response regulator
MIMSPAHKPAPAAAGSGPRFRTVIVDDEPAARRGVRLLLEQDPEIEIVGEASTGEEVVELILREHPAIAFLDVQMPGGDGFQALEKLGPTRIPAIVFVTAYDEHALRAFDVNAIDYLLKPYDDARFAEALRRAKRAAAQETEETMQARLAQLLEYLQGPPPATGTSEPQEHIMVKSSGEYYFLRAAEVDWIEAEGDYMKFHVGGRTHLMRETMARLETRLDPKRFVRIHRSTIVNIDRLWKLSPSFGGDYSAVLHDGTKLRLSRGYHERIARLIKQSF